MRRFWLGLIATTFVFLVTWNVFFHVFARQIFTYDYAIWEAKFDLIETEKSAAEVVILGDSGAVSGLPAVDTKRSTLNLGLSCGGPIEATYAYERYREKHAPPRVLVLQFGEPYYHDLSCLPTYLFSFDHVSLADRAHVLNQLTRAGTKLSLFGESDAIFEALHVPASVRNHLFMALTALHLSRAQLLYARNVVDFVLWRHYDNDYRRTMAGRGHFAIGLADEFVEPRTENLEFDRFDPNPVVIAHLEGLLERARKEGSRVILRIDPFNPNTVARFSDLQKKQLAEFMTELGRRFPEASVETVMRTWPPHAFGDSTQHLNERGATLEGRSLEDAIDEVLAEVKK